MKRAGTRLERAGAGAAAPLAAALVLAALCASAPRVGHTQTPAPRPQGAPTPVVVTERTPNNAAAETPAGGASRAAPGSITGRVVGEGGEPLGGIVVSAMPRTFNNNFRAPRTVAADAEGNFRIDGLDPGVYQLNASTPGYVAETDPLTGRAGGAYRLGDVATIRLVKGGVVTGTVTDMQGEPLAAASVRAYRVRDLEGRPSPAGANYTGEDRTDDRGVYRIYGLQPGVYLVVAGGFSPWSFGPASAFEADAPTFYPSATRDTAVEISVRGGQETAGIDIRYREEQGHRVAGRLEIPAATPDPNSGVGVMLFYASTNINAGSAGLRPDAADRSFSIEGVPEGEYDIQATSGGRDGILSSSAPQRITVRGADVTGLVLTLAPLANVSGKLVVEPAAEAERASAACAPRSAPAAPQESIISAVADRPPPAKGQAPRPASRMPGAREAHPDEAGAFTLRNLEAGRYRLAVRPLDESLYVRSVQLPGATAAAPAVPARAAAAPGTARGAAAASAAHAREVVDLRPGQQLSGVSVRLAEGAAGLAGRVASAEGAAPPPFTQLRIYLVPQERERADDPLRYFEAAATADGAFAFKNLPPGRYLVLARVAPDAYDPAARSALWDADSRSKLRREAESANTPVELQTCQRTTDFTLRFPQTPAKQ